MYGETCIHCGDQLVSPIGPIESDILLIGDVPDWYDVVKGRAFSIGYKKNGHYIDRAGDILRSLLTANSIRPERCRMTNVWLHAKKKVDDCDFEWHQTQAYAEIVNAKQCLFMGTTAVRLLLEDAGAIEWSGLEILSPELPKGTRAMGSVTMNSAFKHLGEAELAVKRFSEMVHEQ